MSFVNPKELYLRIVTRRGTHTLCHDIVVCCGEEELTDELCERKRREIIACLQKELPPDEKIVGSEYVSKDSFTPAIRDNDKVVQWRTMDFTAFGLSYAFDSDGAAHPQFVPTVLLRVLVNDNPCTMGMFEREHIRAMAANYIMETTKNPIYTIDHISPDLYWDMMRHIAVARKDRKDATIQNIVVKVATLKEVERVSRIRVEHFETEKKHNQNKNNP